MDFKTLLEAIIPSALIALILYILFTLRKLERQFYQLLGFNASLRMRVFEQEIRQLESPGIFVHEEIAERFALILLSLLTPEQKQQIEKDYKDNCLPHIPIWKYFLYQYKFNLNIEPRYEIRSFTSVPQIHLHEISQGLKDLEKSLSTLSNKLSRLKSDSNPEDFSLPKQTKLTKS